MTTVEKMATQLLEASNLRRVVQPTGIRYLDERCVDYGQRLYNVPVDEILAADAPDKALVQAIAPWYENTKNAILKEWQALINTYMRNQGIVLTNTGEARLTDFLHRIVEVTPPIQVARFDTHGGDSRWNERTGECVAILRELTEKEADIEDVGRMFHIRFADGIETDAFEDELTILGAV